MRKLLFSIAMAIAVVISLSAQTTTVTVGDESNTSNGYAPKYFCYKNCHSQTIYHSSELQPGLITSISFKVGGSGSYSGVTTIYLAEVDENGFASSSSFYPSSIFTQVYSGTMSYSTGWVTFDLDSPFVYTGESNLALAYVDNATGTYNCSMYSLRSPASETRSISRYSDGTTYTLDVTSGGSSGT